KQAGLNKFEAIKYSAAARFRPILMTSLSTILGILPLALGLGDGAQSRVAMGTAVVGGMIISTILTLYVVPGIYLLISSEYSNANENIDDVEESKIPA
ncbi:MAG TPA: efflux RND transporter permease subunit, partial [Mariniphaga sp.]|nr:efflux RND transporter permease subunit [Mariniphaga sp.]